MATKKQSRKVSKVMREYKSGTLKSSSGKKVTSKKQAVAIAMSEAKMPKKKSGKKPSPPDTYYDRPIYKRQPRDKDDVILEPRGVHRGKRTVYRGKAKYGKLPTAKRGRGSMSA